MDLSRCSQALKILKAKLWVHIIPKNEFLFWVFVLHFRFSFSIFRIAWDSMFLKFLRNKSEKTEALLDVSGNGVFWGAFSEMLCQKQFCISFHFLRTWEQKTVSEMIPKGAQAFTVFETELHYQKLFSTKALKYQGNIQTFGCWSGFGNCRMCTLASNKIRCSLWLATLSFCRYISKNTEFTSEQIPAALFTT